MRIRDFAKAHPVANYCRVSGKALKGKLPVLNLGKLDVPAKVDNRFYCTAIEDQGAKPWCAAYTAAAFAENILWRKTGRIREVEPKDIYAYAKQHDGDPTGDGTTLDVVLDALCVQGLFDANTCKVKMVGRGWLGTDANDVKAAIHRFGCVLGGFNITEEWYELAKSGFTTVTGKKSATLGGHAVLIVGYDKGGVWCENSWGADWGDAGFGYISWKAFADQFMYSTVLTNCLNDFA